MRLIERLKPEWPKPIGPAAHDVLSELCHRLEGIPWFLMGRSLLAVVLTGRLDESDTDIDVAARFSDHEEIRRRIPWKIRQETVEGDRVHQLFYQPEGVLIDFHFFSAIPDHLGYKNQFNKWVTRPALRFSSGRKFVSGYGDVGMPGQTEKWLHDDYGPLWREKY